MVSVVAFSVGEKSGLKENDIYAVGDLMSKKGWHLSALSGPPALHLAMTVSRRGRWPAVNWRQLTGPIPRC
jgi:sphinganine-1-phosphate aldolase